MVSDGGILQWLATPGLRKREVGMAYDPFGNSNIEDLSDWAAFYGIPW